MDQAKVAGIVAVKSNERLLSDAIYRVDRLNLSFSRPISWLSAVMCNQNPPRESRIHQAQHA